MITPMKKATILCLASTRDETVTMLRNLGVFHVVPGANAPVAAGNADASASSADALAARDRALRAKRLLDEVAKDAEVVPEKAPEGPVAARSADALVDRVLQLDDERESLRKRLVELVAEEAEQAPLGDFDPEQVAFLAGKGVPLALFRTPVKVPAPEGEGSRVHFLGATASYRHYVVFGDTSIPEGAEPVSVPARALSEVRADLARTREAFAAAGRELSALAPRAAELPARVEELEREAEFRKVAESLADHGDIATLDGYLPASCVSKLQAAARCSGWALWIREPDPGEKVPVSLTLPRWLRPIAVLFTGLGILPGYREVDVSAVFFVFFSVFFAMIVGDAAYGLLLLAAVIALRLKFRKASAQPFWLFGTFAIVTIIWGALTGSWFAIEPEHLPVWMRGLPWLKLDDHVMWLCFLIGATHLTIANLWNAAVLWPSRKAFAQIGWALMNWTMFFAAAYLVNGQPFPAAAGVVGVVGFLLIVVFMLDRDEIKSEWINYPMLVISLVSALVDVMSYIRLFAVGMASAKIALNFNQMAMGLSLPMWVKPLPTLFILLLGHGLNLVLGALSVLVHAVRLNTLEFSNHIGLTWAGEPYRPFGEAR